MKIACISASNIRHAGENSTSQRVCRIIERLSMEIASVEAVDILSLAQHELRPCMGCGVCYRLKRCTQDEEFNMLYDRLVVADCVFIVSAHYAPIPSKLSMLLEKIEQIAFLPKFHDGSNRSPLFGKPAGIIAHGGGTEEICPHYFPLVVDAIWNALSWPVEMDVAQIDDRRGVVFPVKEVIKTEDSIFPVQIYDFADVETRIKPLVQDVLAKAAARQICTYIPVNQM